MNGRNPAVSRPTKEMGRTADFDPGRPNFAISSGWQGVAFAVSLRRTFSPVVRLV
jgi:hypothetical protein